MKSQTIRIGSGAGYSGDRIEPALELAEKGNIQYLVFECLAERTIALAQLAKKNNPEAGYDPLLEERMRAVLPTCKKNGVKIITNMGAANPVAAMNKTIEIARELELDDLKIAAVTGDDVFDLVKEKNYKILETGEDLSTIKDSMISANAYLGMEPIIEALSNGADIVITGRVADPALFMAPVFHEFEWPLKNWDLVGKGTVLGHLLECAGQVTGGYFTDPGVKDIQDLAHLGFPIAVVKNDGSFFITKVPGTGGQVTLATCKEQLLYEIHDPAQYITPDVIADFSNVTLTQIGKDEVAVKGATGKKNTGKLKVSVGYKDSFIGEGQMSYGGPGAVERGKLALEIVKERLRLKGFGENEAKYDLIGSNALHGNERSVNNEPYEVRARVAVRTTTPEDAKVIGNEVETLYTNGPAGGGGATKSVREVIAVKSVLIDIEEVKTGVVYKTV
ncbi:acyclic terpene utilization AtuA family protein [Draconibacterium sp. IB214405]|uniref:acyclic terpene utilization AtuA family protein n=1 Tax=Draconibacterium sp. IB214405 TaxID=3097352 RepID=UPI002A170B8C|nr:acyclic terpene utilization AtuA family protein [Draconibacterium sp. IB214405]MDX8339780.1 acyclic terpene utilization AtuA family protein [Draconibacterium sp. IB214405]